METTYTGCERRRWDRLPIFVAMFVEWNDDRKRKIVEFATALNIGAGGVLLAVHRRIPAGTDLSIKIPGASVINDIALLDSVNHLQAKVLRVEHRDKAHVVAASFATPLVGNRARAPIVPAETPRSV